MIVVVVVWLDIRLGIPFDRTRRRFAVMLGRQMLIHLILDVEGFFAKMAFEVLPMRRHMDLKIVFVHKALLAKQAAVRFGFSQMADFDVKLPLHLGPEGIKRRVGTNGAFVQFTFVGMLDGEMDLDGDFGIEHLFAKRAAIQVMSVDVHQMLLQLVGFGELLVAALAAVLHRRREEVRASVGVEGIFGRERLVAFAASVRELMLRR